ncbi:hypothetical protein IAU60_004976 [Kwoniella sp. DSM 27419]
MDALIPFTTSGSLVDLVDKKVMVILRDGRKLIGVFRSYDQFANFLLEACVERIHLRYEYAEKDIGILLIRGENVVALGEIDLIAEDMVPLREVPWQQLEEQITADNKRRERDNAVRDKILGQMGFVNEGREGDAY